MIYDVYGDGQLETREYYQCAAGGHETEEGPLGEAYVGVVVRRVEADNPETALLEFVESVLTDPATGYLRGDVFGSESISRPEIVDCDDIDDDYWCYHLQTMLDPGGYFMQCRSDEGCDATPETVYGELSVDVKVSDDQTGPSADPVRVPTGAETWLFDPRHPNVPAARFPGVS